MPGQTGGVTMAPLFAQRNRHMAAGFPLAVTGRKEEINSKYSAHPPCLPPCLNVFLSFSKLKCVGIVCRPFCTYLSHFCVFSRELWSGMSGMGDVRCSNIHHCRMKWRKYHCFHYLVIDMSQGIPEEAAMSKSAFHTSWPLFSPLH